MRSKTEWVRSFLFLLTLLLTAALPLTDQFHHPRAALDYLRAFTPWLQRGANTNLHSHPWTYYLTLLFGTHPTPHGPVFTEAFIGALALVGVIAAFVRRGRFAEALPSDARTFLRFLTFFTLFLLAAYSAIPYKTPWCVLSVDAGLILLAGAGVAVLWRVAPGRVGRVIVAGLFVVGVGQLGWQAWRDSGPLCTDSRNPYVYAGTAPEVEALVQRVDAVAVGKGSESARSVAIQVCSVDGYYWPLPWYLRRYPRVGYYAGLPPTDAAGSPAAPVVIASPELDEALAARLGATHLMTGYFGLRNGVLVEVWVRQDLWENYLKTRNLPK